MRFWSRLFVFKTGRCRDVWGAADCTTQANRYPL